MQSHSRSCRTFSLKLINSSPAYKHVQYEKKGWFSKFRGLPEIKRSFLGAHNEDQNILGSIFWGPIRKLPCKLGSKPVPSVRSHCLNMDGTCTVHHLEVPVLALLHLGLPVEITGTWSLHSIRPWNPPTNSLAANSGATRSSTFLLFFLQRGGALSYSLGYEQRALGIVQLEVL